MRTLVAVPATVRCVASAYDTAWPGESNGTINPSPQGLDLTTLMGRFHAASAVVVDVGGQQSHTAIVAREPGIPTVVSVAGTSTTIPEGVLVTVDGSAGTVHVHGGPSTVSGAMRCDDRFASPPTTRCCTLCDSRGCRRWRSPSR